MASFTSVGFLFLSTVFFLFIVNVSAIVGVDLVEGFEVSTASNFTGISIVDLIIGVVNNFSIFLGLLTVSSEFFLFGSVVITAYAFTVIFMLVQLLRGTGS